MVAWSRSWGVVSRPLPPGRARSAYHRHLTPIANRPLRAACPLIGAGRAPLQAVAGRYAPPPHCLSADAFGCRVWAPLRPCSVSCRERSLRSRSLHDTSRRTLTVACRDYPRLPPPHAGRFSARFARLAQMLPSQALQMPGKYSRAGSWRQTTSLRSVVHRQERALLALLLQDGRRR